MPSLKTIRTRITSIKNTQKITRALKLVAAARLRRSQEAIVAARPYAHALHDVIAEVAARAGADAHPLLEVRPKKRVELIVVTADRGLAGSFNSSLSRAAERFVAEHRDEYEVLQLAVVGRKGRDYLRRRKHNVAPRDLAAPLAATALPLARELTHSVIERYLDRKLDAVFVLYNEFRSAISQQVRLEQLLPVRPKKLPAGGAGDYLYEPSQAQVLDAIVPLAVEIELYRGMLESIASFFGAQMTAMDSATKNASEMIGKYTLQYNRARQAAITKELLEIIGGAEALKG
jgi:F-type H+-transporting ATPase subunit gamma